MHEIISGTSPRPRCASWDPADTIPIIRSRAPSHRVAGCERRALVWLTDQSAGEPELGRAHYASFSSMVSLPWGMKPNYANARLR